MGDVHVGRQAHRPVVGRLDAALARQRIHEELLRSIRVRHPETDREHEFRRVVGDLDRPQRRESEPRLFTQIHLRHEEAHVLADVAVQDLGRAARNAVSVLAEPRRQAARFLRGENQDVVLAHGVARLDRDAQALLAGGRRRGHLRDRSHLPVEPVLVLAPARVRVVVLDETRRRIRVQTLQELRVADVDLALFDRARHRDHDREVLRIALVVASHGHDRVVAVADEGDLRGAVIELRVRLRDVEAAESAGRPRGEKGAGQAQGEDEGRGGGSAHGKLL